MFLFVALAMMLKGDSHAQLRRLLSNIPSITVALVNLEYKEQVLPPTDQAVCTDKVLYTILLVWLHIMLYCIAGA